MSNPKANKPKSSSTVSPSRAKQKATKGKMVKIYVWELPVRVFHWVNVFAILVLIITGIYIARPFVGAGIPEDAYYSFLMGWVRYAHFFAAFLFTANLIFRLYWVAKGNQYSRSNPFKLQFWKETWEVLKYYLFLPNKKKHYIGHNRLAELSYWIFIGLGSIIMVFTGFFLFYEPQFDSFIGNIFSYVGLVFGGDSFSVRSWHHLVAWGYMIFMVIHIYMSIREDWLSRNGTISSIFTGYKTEVIHEEQQEKKAEGDKSA